MIKVLTSGLLTSFQDLGRYGYRASGVPVSGVMDAHSAVFANELVCNHPNAVVLEFTFIGPTMTFHQDSEIAICGALFKPMLNNKRVELNLALKIKKGDVLAIGNAIKGVRGYLAVQGGFISQEVLGSKSMYHKITTAFKIKKGAILKIDDQPKNSTQKTIPGPLDFESNILEVFPAPEFHLLEKNTQEKLLNPTLKITPQNSRMGYILEPEISIPIPEIITAAVQPGTVQITPSGKWIFLHRDAQTTGGYGRIFQLTAASLNCLSQKRAREEIRLKLVE